jgi:N-carbamoyl-L-amino-acid hydrolase
MQLVFDRIEEEAGRIAEGNATPIAFAELDLAAPPAPTDERLRAIVAQAADELGLTHKRMPSGAGHDAQDLAKIAPIGMIFVPSVGGISHSPREFTSAQDMANGASVLLRTVLAVDGGAL